MGEGRGPAATAGEQAGPVPGVIDEMKSGFDDEARVTRSAEPRRGIDSSSYRLALFGPLMYQRSGLARGAGLPGRVSTTGKTEYTYWQILFFASTFFEALASHP